jgi:DNA-binding transcriptional MerR regulator
MPNQYSIRELSREFEVTTRTLRFYEEKGLLAPVRDGQNRVYSAADRARLVLILRGKTLGLSLEQSADLISMYDPASNNKKQLEVLIDKICARRAHLERQKQELEQMIVDLEDWELRSRAAIGSKLGKLGKIGKVGKVARDNSATTNSTTPNDSVNGELS